MHTPLRDKIEQDLKTALRAKEELRLSVLRMISASLHNREIEKKGRTGSGGLDDEEVLSVFRQELKKRKDAAEGFEKGGRPDSAEKEREEARIIEAYLPEELSSEEIEKIVKEVVSGIGEVTQKDFGRVMGEVMKQAKGRVSGERVSAILKKFLQK
ncbi:MAG: GatB/YqeY domain-containing protein [Candidatus Sungbacteria bacterium]|nr:GatB/YqeY domain-containing protein [Candidatus Sungbacteria bacterium]